MSKKGTNFVDANDIETVANACFKRLQDKNYFKNQSIDAFIDDIVDFYCITNMLHPFRDDHVIIRTKLEKPSKIKGLALI